MLPSECDNVDAQYEGEVGDDGEEADDEENDGFEYLFPLNNIVDKIFSI